MLPESKVCARCKTRKPAGDFSIIYPKDYRRAAHLNPYCKACESEIDKVRRYRLTDIQYQAILSEQNGKCALCKGFYQRPDETLCVDHIRDTDIVRGLLCLTCNLTVRNHSVEHMEAATEYVRRRGRHGNN